ncbi:MAG TPA: N-acetylneuraminate synthase family protein [Polyangia bacterium]|nr:N-acetylneuraminate synthase family protein [Polyangia bacterium]
MSFEVAGRNVAERVLVIAEIGNNHEGDAELAHQMVRAAVAAGADAVKFQTFKTEQFIDRAEQARFRQLSSYELDFDDFASLARLTRELGALFISSPFDAASAEFLAAHADAIKIASGDNDHYPLIRQAAASELPLIISTGLSDLDRVQRAADSVVEVRGEDLRLALLHCVSSYPVAPEEANLASIAVLAERFGLPVGFSDHTIGIEAAPAAVAAGARIVEKHFTLAGIESDFRDHELSADEDELTRMVSRIREVETLLGAPGKRPQPSEAATHAAVRRSAIAARELEEGAELAASEIWWVRPGGGISPTDEAKLIGRRLRRGVSAGERLTLEDLE